MNVHRCATGLFIARARRLRIGDERLRLPSRSATSRWGSLASFRILRISVRKSSWRRCPRLRQSPSVSPALDLQNDPLSIARCSCAPFIQVLGNLKRQQLQLPRSGPVWPSMRVRVPILARLAPPDSFRIVERSRAEARSSTFLRAARFGEGARLLREGGDERQQAVRPPFEVGRGKFDVGNAGTSP